MPIVPVPGHGPLLFVHIPKTGGTSIESYFIKKGVDPTSMLSSDTWIPTHTAWKRGVSLQHQTFRDIVAHTKATGGSMKSLPKMCVVRNPYTRVVSDLFFNGLINDTSTAADVEIELKKYVDAYLNNEIAFDNHARPQVDMIRNRVNKILPGFRILRCETLTADMRALGFTDFNVHENRNRHQLDDTAYMNLLTDESIRIINEVYAEDFATFGYPMISNT